MEMRRLQSDIDNLLKETWGHPPSYSQSYSAPSYSGGWALPGTQLYPAINLWLGENSVMVTTELPGLGADDVDLTVRENTLTIRGERKTSAPDNADWHRQERVSGEFTRTIALPFRVDPDKVQARFADGVLEVEMQRPDADRPKKITINT
jgi:HSP20 family protein